MPAIREPAWSRPRPRPAPNYVELHAARPAPAPAPPVRKTWSAPLSSSHPFLQPRAPAPAPAPRPRPRPAPRRPEAEPRTATSYLSGMLQQARQSKLPPPLIARLLKARTEAEARERTAHKQEPRTAASYLAGQIGTAEHSPLTTPRELARLRRGLGLAEGQAEARARVESEARQRAKGGWKINVPGAGEINLSHVALALATAKLPDWTGIPGKLASEVFDLPGQTFLGGVQAGSAARAAIGGDTRQAEAMGHQLLSQIEHPVRSVKEAPLSTALMFAGGENAFGRLLGRAGRLGERVDEAGRVTKPGLVPSFSRQRPDVMLYGEKAATDTTPAQEGLRISRRLYNADPLRASLQKLFERQRYGEPVTAPTGEPAFQARGEALKRHVSGGAFKIGSLDIASSGGERTRRAMVRGTANKMSQRQREVGEKPRGREALQIRRERNLASSVLGAKPKLGRDAVPLIYQSIVTTPQRFESDLRELHDKWKAAGEAEHEDGTPKLTGADKAENAENVKRVGALLEDKALLAHVREKGWKSEPFRAAARIKKLHSPFVAARLFGGQLKHDQLRAALFPYAQQHMGARYYSLEDHAAAEKAYADAGDHERALTVSGRPRPAVEAHRALQGAHKRAHDETVKANLDRATAERKLDRLVTLQRSHRARRDPEAVAQTRMRINRERAKQGLEPLKGNEDRLVPMGKRRGPREATAKERRELEAARQAHDKAKAAHKDAQKLERRAKAELDDSKMPEAKAGLRGPHGEQLTDTAILEHMEHHGVPVPGYMSHVRGVKGRGSYFRSVLRQPKLERFNRTGSAFENGTADHSWEALTGTVAKHASEAAQLEVRRRQLNRFAIGQHDTAARADAAAENFRFHPDGEKVMDALGEPKVVHIGSKQIVEKGHIAPVPTEDVLRQFGLHEHVTAAHRELGGYSVVPDHVLKRMEAHDKALSSDKEAGRAMQAYAQAWRHAKLNTSMPHIVGVIQEQAIRLLAEQAGPTSALVGRKYDRSLKRLAQIDTHGYIADSHGPLGERYRALESVLGGRGGLVETQRWNDAVRLADQFQETSAIGRLMRAGSRGLHTPPGKLAWHSWQAWRYLIEGSLAKVEHASYNAHLGKALRETGMIDNFRSVLKAQEDGMKAMIEGRLTPNSADALARKVDNMMGNWTHQTPDVRRFVGKWAPFGLWYLNSLRWLYRLPVTHPIKAGILGAIYAATREKREGEGQGTLAPKRVPNFLQGAIPVDLPLVGKVHAAPSYYSPMGALGAEWGATAAEQVIPYGTSIYSALGGEQPLSHEKLKTAKGEDLTPLQVALNTVAELTAGPTPLATQGQTALLRGGKPYGTANWITELAHELGVGPAQAKPGTAHSWPEVLGKMISPTRLIRNKATQKGSGSLDPLQQHRLKEAEGEAQHMLSDPLVKQRIREAEAMAAGR